MVVQTPMTCIFGSCRACNTAQQRTFPRQIPRSPLAPPGGCARSAACGPSTGVRSPRAALCSALVSALARLHGRQAAVGSGAAAGRPAGCSGSRGAASGASPAPPGGQASNWGPCKGCRQKAQPTCSRGQLPSAVWPPCVAGRRRRDCGSSPTTRCMSPSAQRRRPTRRPQLTAARCAQISTCPRITCCAACCRTRWGEADEGTHAAA